MAIGRQKDKGGAIFTSSLAVNSRCMFSGDKPNFLPKPTFGVEFRDSEMPNFLSNFLPNFVQILARS